MRIITMVVGIKEVINLMGREMVVTTMILRTEELRKIKITIILIKIRDVTTAKLPVTLLRIVGRKEEDSINLKVVKEKMEKAKAKVRKVDID